MDVSSLLLSGARMTAQHCPVCSYPLFEKDGKTFCANCKEKKPEGNLFERKESELLSLLEKEREPEKIKPILECLLLLKRIGERDVPKRT